MSYPELPSGSSYVCFDASPLMHYADASELATLASWFGFGTCFIPAVILDVEIPRGLKNHPQNKAILDASWLQRAQVLDDDFEFIVDLRNLWGSPGNRDYGEAEVVALCRRYGWTAIMNDGRGRAAARQYGVASVCTGSLLAAAVAEGMLSVDQGWHLHQRVEAGFSRPMILPTGDEYRFAFERTVTAVRRWTEEHQGDVWPGPLSMTPRVDDLLARAVGHVEAGGASDRGARRRGGG